MKFGSRLCTLNVGGRRFSFPADLMKHLPLSRLSRLHGCGSESELLELCDDYDRDKNEFFFDRHSEAFSFIMLYVQHGKLRFVPHMCELSFYNEMLYWGLESSDLQPCCQRRLDDCLSDCFVHFFPEEEQGEREDPQSHWLERMRKTFEEPMSSLMAQILASVSVLFVVISIVMLCASTLPDWKAEETVDKHSLLHQRPVVLSWNLKLFEFSDQNQNTLGSVGVASMNQLSPLVFHQMRVLKGLCGSGGKPDPGPQFSCHNNDLTVKMCTLTLTSELDFTRFYSYWSDGNTQRACWETN